MDFDKKLDVALTMPKVVGWSNTSGGDLTGLKQNQLYQPTDKIIIFNKLDWPSGEKGEWLKGNVSEMAVAFRGDITAVTREQLLNMFLNEFEIGDDAIDQEVDLEDLTPKQQRELESEYAADAEWDAKTMDAEQAAQAPRATSPGI